MDRICWSVASQVKQVSYQDKPVVTSQIYQSDGPCREEILWTTFLGLLASHWFWDETTHRIDIKCGGFHSKPFDPNSSLFFDRSPHAHTRWSSKELLSLVPIKFTPFSCVREFFILLTKDCQIAYLLVSHWVLEDDAFRWGKHLLKLQRKLNRRAEYLSMTTMFDIVTTHIYQLSIFSPKRL